MKCFSLLLLFLILVFGQLLVDGIVWQTLPFIAIIVFFLDYLGTLLKTKRLSFGEPLWKSRDFGTGISLNPASRLGYYSLVSVCTIVILTAFVAYLSFVFPGVENALHQISGLSW